MAHSPQLLLGLIAHGPLQEINSRTALAQIFQTIDEEAGWFLSRMTFLLSSRMTTLSKMGSWLLFKF